MAVDVDRGADDPIGATALSPDGSFELSASARELGGPQEGSPEVKLYLFREGSQVHEESLTADPDVSVDITIDPPTYPSVEDIKEAMCNMHHGMSEQRGIENVPRDPFHPGHGRFGRMFPNLESADHDVGFLQELGLPGGPLDESAQDRSVGESAVPAGFAILGQFIDHDITLDPLSELSRRNDPDALRNFRTPRLDLDSVYATGPEASPYLYESPLHSGDNERLLVALDDRPDVPRNAQGTALIGDHRNDENHLISQFQYAMLRFHNAIIERLGEDCKDAFEDANQLARWHYQWIVLEEFLPTVCDEDVVSDIRENGRDFYTVERGERPFLPLEFTVAAYRYGHSQIREQYRVNEETEAALFGSGDDSFGIGFEAPSKGEAVDWRHLFNLKDPAIQPQNARAIDPLLSPDLLDLPFIGEDQYGGESAEEWRRSLASRNLVRGHSFQLPSGQAIARAMGIEPLSNAKLGFEELLDEYDQHPGTEAPLWYYILQEARLESGGDHLGTVGSRIVAETLIGLIELDPSSYLTVQPAWTPVLPGENSGVEEFTIADLLEFAYDEHN